MIPTAESLVLSLHGQLLRMIAARTGLHFQGLSQASRRLRSIGWISLPVAKKLVMIDHSFNLIRHITCASTMEFTEHVDQVLSNSPNFARQSGHGVIAAPKVDQNHMGLSAFELPRVLDAEPECIFLGISSFKPVTLGKVRGSKVKNQTLKVAYPEKKKK